jgi:carbon storage regulator CsrA
MLVLSRRLNQKILIPSVKTAIEVVAIKAGVVRLGIQAPPEVTILREEVPNRSMEEGASPAAPAAAVETALRQVQQLVRTRLALACKGLEQARRFLPGAPVNADTIVEHVEEDLRLLLERMEEGTLLTLPPPVRPNLPRRALLVEDDQNERELLASLLRLSGVEVDTAGDGLDALQLLQGQDRPDVVLLDMGLPHCDGATTVRKIRRDPTLAGLKIFAVTGSSPDQFDLAQGPKGIDRWFRKPIDSEALLRELQPGN